MSVKSGWITTSLIFKHMLMGLSYSMKEEFSEDLKKEISCWSSSDWRESKTIFKEFGLHRSKMRTRTLANLWNVLVAVWWWGYLCQHGLSSLALKSWIIPTQFWKKKKKSQHLSCELNSKTKWVMQLDNKPKMKLKQFCTEEQPRIHQNPQINNDCKHS